VIESLMTDRGLWRWLVNRFRSTESGEIFSRSVEVFRHLALAAGINKVNCRDRRYPERAGDALATLTADFVERVSDEEKKRALAIATEWLSHRVYIFALRGQFVGDSIDWHQDYSSGVVGPKKYSALINYRAAERVGDVKYTWELNRLQHLILLALASVWTANEAYDREIQKETYSWYHQNPFMIGLNWKSPLEAAMRLISWAAVSFVKRASSGENIFHKEFPEAIYQHQYFISKFYSKHSSANNHLIGEMAGLYVASVFWPYYKESSSWRSFARQKLIEEILRQVDDDGVGKERATEYQLFILEFFLLAGALGSAIGDPFPEEYWQRIGGMAVFLAAISDRNSNMPMFGDSDSAQVVWLPESTQDRLRVLLRICQISNSKMGGESERDLRSHLLLWGQEFDKLPLLPVPGARTELQVFAKGGYYVLAANRGEDDEIIVVFDAAPLGLPPLYAHGHADALSFWLSYGGQEFLIDPGTLCYYTLDKWRAYFRGTPAHNTVRVDGLDQSVTGGRFIWRHIARSQALHVENNDEFVNVRAFHDGYKRLPDPVIHKRDIRLFKKRRSLVIADFLECKGTHDIEIFFHFSEQCSVEQEPAGFFTALSGKRRVGLNLDSRFEPKLYWGSDEPISGWVSRSFGVKEPSYTIAASTTIVGSAEFLSEIRLF
jgi:Heparinase II/III-like protein/Heparinase II/III N-terminus